MLAIREVKKTDLDGLLKLYTELHDSKIPDFNEKLEKLWNDLLENPHEHIIVGCKDGIIVSSCTVIIIQNLTHNQHPYALVENVITSKPYRKQGYASIVIDYARAIAIENHCYKMMLMTSSKEADTLRFYEQAGYNRQDKIGFVQWLNVND